jgi:carboxypeptidase PM20D1
MIGVAEKGYATLKVTAPAPGGHSSTPPAETGAVHLARAILAINEHPFPLELRSPTREMVELMADRAGGVAKIAAANQWLFAPVIRRQMAATPASAAMMHTTIAPTMLAGSPKENVLPQDAHALINYRIAPWDSSARVLVRAREAVRGLPVKVDFTERKPREPSPISSATSPGWRAIVASARAGHPGLPAVPNLVIAGTDSRSMSGVSDDVYRFQPLAIASTEIKMIHGTNEHMTVKNLDSMISFFTRLVATSAR